MKNIPNTVYRYRSFSASTVEMLCNDVLFFANPVTFNDPFDCSPFVDVDSGTLRLQAILQQLISTRVHGETIAALKSAKFDENSATTHAMRIAQLDAARALDYIQYHATNPDYDDPLQAEINMLRNNIETELQDRYGKGICCFSEEHDNPLLWSHYGDQHRGICIGYSIDRIPIPDLKPVNYNGDRKISTSLIDAAIIQKHGVATATLDAKVLLQKAPEWSYEKEWRLISNVGLQDSPLRLTEVTFGLRCPDAVRHTLVQALNRRSVQVEFYEMGNTWGTFQLERCPLDIERTCFLPRTAISGEEAFGSTNAVNL